MISWCPFSKNWSKSRYNVQTNVAIEDVGEEEQIDRFAIAFNILDRCACSTGSRSIPDSGWPGRLPTPTSY